MSIINGYKSMGIFVLDLVESILKNLNSSPHSNISTWPFLKNKSHPLHSQKFHFQCDKAFLFQTESPCSGPNHVKRRLVHHIKVAPRPL